MILLLDNVPELLNLLNLLGGVKLDLENLKRHVDYIGGYTSSRKVIRWLWQIVAEFSAEGQGKFLKFVTSCGKPPVLGFEVPQPVFTIRAVSGSSREGRYTVAAWLPKEFDLAPTRTGFRRLQLASICLNCRFTRAK